MEDKRKYVSKRWCAWAVIVLGIFIITHATVNEARDENRAGQQPAPSLATPQPQFFCGTCHILTYPAIIKRQHELWEKGKHNKVACVTCHYGPDKSKPAGDTSPSHLPAQPPPQFTHLKIGGAVVQTRAKIDDATCMTVDCHGKPDDNFKTKKIQFTEKVTFVHQPHFEAKNQIKGQKIGCTNCHQHETDLKKFEVSKDSCYVCHFMGTKLNDGRSRCELCHKLPEAPIKAPVQQTKDEWGADEETPKTGSAQTEPAKTKPITHAMLKQAGVACASCHFDLVQSGTGATYTAFFENGILKTAIVYGVGQIKKENCMACHDKEKDLKQAMAMELMHERHITDKTARCLDCHQPVVHIKAKLEERIPQDDDPVLLTGCTTCHPVPHYYQRVLTSGYKSPAYDHIPDPMYGTLVNCMGCHTEQITLPKGQTVLKASEKTCISCHDKTYENTLKAWKAELNDRINSITQLEKEILKTLDKAKTKLSEDKLTEAMGQLKEAQEDLKIVQFGNGVHNKTYALHLLDKSTEKFKGLKQKLANMPTK
jgi:hypothetical protein